MRPRRTDFSRPGEPVTDLERAIVAEASVDPCPTNAMVVLAARIGIDALAAVLDELGGQKAHIPTRQDFFRALYVPRRDRHVRELSASGRFGDDELARLFGLSRRHLRRIRGAMARTTGPGVRATSARRG